MTMRIFLGVLVILAVLFGVYVYMNPTPTPELTPPTSDSGNSSSDAGNAPGGTVPTQNEPMPSGNGEAGITTTLQGTLTCLPHKGDGPHTMECAYGLKADNGSYYALQGLWEVAPNLTETGVRVSIMGSLSEPEPTEKYDIEGTVFVMTAEKI